MNAPREPVTSCIIETDTLHSQTTFYDVKTKSCNTDIVSKWHILKSGPETGDPATLRRRTREPRTSDP